MTMVTTETQPLLLAGVPTEGSETAAVVFPYDGSEVARVWLAGEELLEQALAAPRPGMCATRASSPSATRVRSRPPIRSETIWR